jgi:hypothetical protein
MTPGIVFVTRSITLRPTSGRSTTWFAGSTVPTDAVAAVSNASAAVVTSTA